MRQFSIAILGVLGLALSTSNIARAQIVYGYSFPVYGGVESTGTVVTPNGERTFTNYTSPYTGTIGQSYGTYYTPYGAKTYSNFYSPATVVVGQSYSTNIYGAANSTNYVYNPYTGYKYGTGFYQPNAIVAPYYGTNYNFIRRR